jgi:hypothetical protein
MNQGIDHEPKLLIMVGKKYDINEKINKTSHLFPP